VLSFCRIVVRRLRRRCHCFVCAHTPTIDTTEWIYATVDSESMLSVDLFACVRVEAQPKRAAHGLRNVAALTGDGGAAHAQPQ
jgi:hypothetical protein